MISQREEQRRVRLLACATQGSESDDEARLRSLVHAFDATFVAFRKQSKLRSALSILQQLRSRKYALFVLEGSGVAGGMAALAARFLWRIPYVVSSGDAVGPFLSGRHPMGKPIFFLYEKLLSGKCSGFIGWTPYLVGRALTYGAPRGVTIPGWSPYTADEAGASAARSSIRQRFGIPDHAVVFGLVGSLHWSERYRYCYGAELVRAARLAGDKPYVLVAGDGTGLDRLRALAGEALGKTIFLPGRIRRDEVPSYLAAMDVGCIPQSLDGVGSFRYTTKLSEYKASRLPYVTNQIPMSYDLDEGCLWRLPGASPWDERFLQALSELMLRLGPQEIREKRQAPAQSAAFDKESQLARVTAFLTDVIDAQSSRS